ncbi:hypothetical protein DYB30_004768 [Aphanomyces astaci]|uniref:Uncharacterized protein n=2 Tax=Aphanomyces astaci TaxID=112090 RepID=A0A397EA20_APHAT|nr:hypothetical protein DYB30_004768 [Aphanomyces astaci]
MNKYTEVTFELFEDAIRALYGQVRMNSTRVIAMERGMLKGDDGSRRTDRSSSGSRTRDPTQTQYFCANMLYGKIRQEWFGLTTGEQEAIQLQVELLIQRIRSGSLRSPNPLPSRPCPFSNVDYPIYLAYSFAPIVLKRICMAMTALSLATDGGCARCVTDCTQHVSSLVDVHVSLELLTSLVDDTDDARKDALVLEITDASAVVFPFVARLFDTQQLSSDVLRLNGLTCLRVWIKAAGFSLAKLYSNMPAVFQALLQALHHPQTAPGPVKEVVVCALILSDALEINEYPPATSKDAATAALLSTLLSCQPTIQYYLLHDAQVAHAITTLISTLGEAELDWLVLDYPVASRHVAFQDAAFRRLLHTLVRQSCASDDEEQDDVTAFRLAATDLLVAIHHLLKASFVADMVHLMTSSKATEAAMFALTAVSSELKLRLADDVPTQQMVLHLCTSILFADVTSSPSVVVVASAFLGNLGPLIHAQWTTHGAADTSLLDSTFQYLCFGMTVSVASSAACRAFNVLCASCTLGHLDKQDRQWVVEGVVRVAAVSAWGRLALEQLLHSIFSRLAVPSSPTPSHVPMELHALGTVLRFLDAPSAAAGGPALTQHVVDLSWPHITRVASAAPSLPLDGTDLLLSFLLLV